MKKPRLLMSIIIGLCFCWGVSAEPLEPPEFDWGSVFLGDGHAECFSIKLADDGGFFLAGWTGPADPPSSDGCLVKLNSSGVLEWTKNYGGDDNDSFYAFNYTNDGGFIFAGKTTSWGAGSGDFYWVKANGEGGFEWQNYCGGSSYDQCNSVTQTADDGYIMCGSTNSYGAGWNDIYIVKADYSGVVEWEKTFGGPYDDFGNAIIRTYDDYFVCAGVMHVDDTNEKDILLLKIDTDGDSLWGRTFGGPFEQTGMSLCQTADGGFIVTGYSATDGENYDVYLVKTDEVGNLEWDTCLGNTNYEISFNVLQTNSGHYIVGGIIDLGVANGGLNMMVMKVDSMGSLVWRDNHDGGGNDFCRSVLQTADGGYVLAGSSVDCFSGAPWMTIIHLKSDVGVSEDFQARIPSEVTLSTHPNPFNPTTTLEFSLPQRELVSLEIYDVTGKLVTILFKGMQNAGTHQMVFDASTLSSGVYFAQLSAGDYNAIQKLLLVK